MVVLQHEPRLSTQPADLSSVANELSPLQTAGSLFLLIATDYPEFMKSDCTKIDDIAWLETRIRENRLRNERRESRVARETLKIATANEEYVRLMRVLEDAKANQYRAPLPGTRRRNLKNEKVMQVWAATQDAFSGQFARQGLATNELSRAIREAIPGIPDSTVRSHLHRFKGKGALTQIGFRWFLESHARYETHSDASSGYAVTQVP